MLKITIPKGELFDKRTKEFIQVKEQTLTLEHSLVSIAKWESKFKKPFLSTEKKTVKESVEYVKCMTLTQNVDPNVYLGLTNENMRQVDAYIEESMTATWFSDDKKKTPNQRPMQKEVITAEIVYFWMINFNIPFECQKWHFSRLITLIRVCEAKSAKPKKMSKSALNKHNTALNAARLRALNTTG